MSHIHKRVLICIYIPPQKFQTFRFVTLCVVFFFLPLVSFFSRSARPRRQLGPGSFPFGEKLPSRDRTAGNFSSRFGNALGSFSTRPKDRVAALRGPFRNGLRGSFRAWAGRSVGERGK